METIDGSNVLMTRDDLIKMSAIISWSTKEKFEKYLATNESKIIVPLSFIEEISKEISSKIRPVKERLMSGKIIAIVEEKLSQLLEGITFPIELLREENGILVVDSELINRVYEILLLKDKLYSLEEYATNKQELEKNLKSFCSEEIMHQMDREFQECFNSFNMEGLEAFNIKFYKLQDFIMAKRELDKDLRYFCSEETMFQMDREFQEQFNNLNMKGLKAVLDRGYDLIREHWKSYITDLQDFKNGGSYNLLCHSTDSTEFNGPFYTRYVSCSLLCEQLTDTYNSGFGFIMPSTNIVLANSSDMYIKNEAESEEELVTRSSTIKKLSSPERLKEEALKQKEEYLSSGIDDKVYTEIVVDGFHPIGIFCMDDGSKTLNDNYRNALKLKENFPELEIVLLDVMFQKKGSELDGVRRKLTNRIAEATGILKPGTIFNNIYNKYTSYKDFDLFWKKYLELIKQEDYSEKDIIGLFKENLDLISPNLNLNGYLFDGTYSEEQLRQILYYNPQIRLIDIMEGKASVSLLDNIYSVLFPYTDNSKIESIVPGISTFLKLYPKAMLDENSKEELGKCDSLESLIQYLSGRVMVSNFNIEGDSRYGEQLGVFEQERLDIEDIIQDYEEAIECSFMEPSYVIAKQDVFDIENEIYDCKASIEELENEMLSSSNSNSNQDRATNSSTHSSISITGLKKKIEMNPATTFSLVSQGRKQLESLIGELQEVKNRFYTKTGFSFHTYRDKLSKSNDILFHTDIVSVRIRLGMLSATIDKTKSMLENCGDKNIAYGLEGAKSK